MQANIIVKKNRKKLEHVLQENTISFCLFHIFSSKSMRFVCDT